MRLCQARYSFSMYQRKKNRVPTFFDTKEGKKPLVDLCEHDTDNKIFLINLGNETAGSSVGKVPAEAHDKDKLTAV